MQNIERSELKNDQKRGIRPNEMQETQNILLSNTDIDQRYFDHEKYDYQMLRFNILGQIDHNLEINLTQRGWKLVPKNRVPDAIHFDNPLNSSTIFNDYVVKQDTVLAERPKEISRQIEEAENKKRDNIMATYYARGIIQDDYHYYSK